MTKEEKRHAKESKAIAKDAGEEDDEELKLNLNKVSVFFIQQIPHLLKQQ
jgi:hypothetical protein